MGGERSIQPKQNTAAAIDAEALKQNAVRRAHPVHAPVLPAKGESVDSLDFRTYNLFRKNLEKFGPVS
jgi:hypothetical protein